MTINQLLTLKPGQQIRLVNTFGAIATVIGIGKGMRFIGNIQTGYFKQVPYVQTAVHGGWYADQVELVE